MSYRAMSISLGKYLDHWQHVKGHFFLYVLDSKLCRSLLINLKVDASQGVQAQSISVFHNAKERGLKIIPVLNKV